MMPPKHRPRGWRPAEKAFNPAHAYYHTAQWKTLRQMVIARERGICRQCGAHGAWHVDHIKPRSEGGADHPDNLRLLCATCDNRRHRDKGLIRY
jgi:5-methylcytosine-specific restriction endonuclease McrA